MIDASWAALAVGGGVLAALAFACVTTVLARLSGDEISGWLPVWSSRFLDSAVLIVPPEHQERYRKEWRAELAAFDGRPLSGLRFAWRLRRRAHSVHEALCEAEGVRSIFETEAPTVEGEALDAEAIAAIVRRAVDKTKPRDHRPEEDLIETLLESRESLDIGDAPAEITQRYLSYVRDWRRETTRRQRASEERRKTAIRSRFRLWS